MNPATYQLPESFDPPAENPRFTAIDELERCESCDELCADLKVVDTDDEFSGSPMCEDCLFNYYDYDETCKIYRVKEEV